MEALLPVEPARRYPMCTGSRRSVPLEGCGGPWAFMEFRQHYSPLRLLELLAVLLEADPDQRGEVLGDRYEELESCAGGCRSTTSTAGAPTGDWLR